jgi:hypothetical protein
MAWDPSQGDRRRIKRHSREELAEQLRNLAANVDDFRLRVDALNRPTEGNQWESRRSEKPADDRRHGDDE